MSVGHSVGLSFICVNSKDWSKISGGQVTDSGEVQNLAVERRVNGEK